MIADRGIESKLLLAYYHHGTNRNKRKCISHYRERYKNNL